MSAAYEFLNQYNSIEGYGKDFSNLLSEPFEIYAPNTNIHIPGRMFKSIYGGNIIVPASFVLMVNDVVQSIGTIMDKMATEDGHPKTLELEFINKNPIVFNDIERDFGGNDKHLQCHLEYWPFFMAASNSIAVTIEGGNIVSYVFNINYKTKYNDSDEELITDIIFAWDNM